ncbi:hypothetical protein ES708_20274 [subsurface metagenome]
MNQYLKTMGLGLAGKLIDLGVAKITSPHRTSPQERIEQINKTLETLESAPAEGQHPARPPTEAPQSQKEAVSGEKSTSTTIQEPESLEQEDIATACVPCGVGHFAGAAKLLSEAFRFRDDGITSNQVLDDIAGAIGELNAMERVDLTPEKLQNTFSWERPIADEALRESRKLRHRLEGISSMGEVEQAAADSERFYKKLFRGWFKRRFAHLGPEKAQIIADEVGRLSPEDKDRVLKRAEELVEGV